MASVYRLRGLPGCGKSTYAQQLLNVGAADIRINRDSVREICGYTAPDTSKNAAKEPFITRITDAMEIVAIQQKKSVILDNVNGPDKGLARFKAAGYTIWDVWFQTPLDTCIAACQNRDRKVPEHVIMNFVKKYPHLNPTNPTWGVSKDVLSRKVVGFYIPKYVTETSVNV